MRLGAQQPTPTSRLATTFALATVALAVAATASCDTPEFVDPSGRTPPPPPPPPVEGSVSGVVRVEGQPTSGVRASLTPGSASDWTDATGSFRFAGLDSGSYTVTITPPRLTAFDSVAKPATVSRESPHVVVAFNGAWFPTASIRGLVAIEGQPADRTVLLTGDAIEADREAPGPEFAFDSLPAGRYALTARPLSTEPDLRFDTLEIELERAQAVVDTVNGAWLRTAAIRGSVVIDGLEDRTPGRRIVLESGVLPDDSLVFVLGGSGGFAFNDLRAASYTVTARAGSEEDVAFDLTRVNVSPGDTILQNARGRWIRESAIEGYLTIDGKLIEPLPHRVIRLTAPFLPSPLEFLSSRSPSTSTAWFARERLRSGRYTVTAVPLNHEAGLVFDRVSVTVENYRVGRVAVNGQWQGGLAQANTTAYLVQSIQRRDGAVDLVLGKPTLLRAFVTSTLPRPWPDSVTADIVVEAPGGTIARCFRLERGRSRTNTGLPDAVKEWDLGSSYNVLLPDGIVVPGNGLHVTTQAHFGAAARQSFNTESRFRHDQRRAVHAPAKDFRVIVVPFHTGDQEANARLDARVGGLNRRDPFFALALEALPLGVFSLDVRDPVRIDPTAYGSICSWLGVLDERRHGDQTSFYYGVFDYYADDVGGPYAGCAWLGFPTAVGFISTTDPRPSRRHVRPRDRPQPVAYARALRQSVRRRSQLPLPGRLHRRLGLPGVHRRSGAPRHARPNELLRGRQRVDQRLPLRAGLGFREHRLVQARRTQDRDPVASGKLCLHALQCPLEADQPADQGVVARVGVRRVPALNGKVQRDLRRRVRRRCRRHVQPRGPEPRRPDQHQQRLDGNVAPAQRFKPGRHQLRSRQVARKRQRLGRRGWAARVGHLLPACPDVIAATAPSSFVRKQCAVMAG